MNLGGMPLSGYQPVGKCPVCGKDRFSTRRRAKDAIVYLRGRGLGSSRNGVRRVYKCNGYWHMTSIYAGTQAKIREREAGDTAQNPWDDPTLRPLDFAPGMPGRHDPYWSCSEPHRACLDRLAVMWLADIGELERNLDHDDDDEDPAEPPSPLGAGRAWWLLRYPDCVRLRALIYATGWTPVAVEMHLSALRAVLRHCQQLGLMSGTDYHQSKSFGVPGGHELVALLHDAITEEGPIAVRNAALIAVLLSTDITPREAAAALVEDYDAREHTLTVPADGASLRVVRLSPYFTPHLDRWLALAGKSHGPLFRTVSRWHHIGDEHMTVNSVRGVVNRRRPPAGPEVSARPKQAQAATMLKTGGTPMPEPAAIPHLAAKMSAQLLEATGQQPVVVFVGNGRWRLTLAGPRVRVTVDFQGGLGKKARWAASELFVDGRQRPIAKDLDDFVRIWNNPDGEAEVQLAAVPAGGDIASAPQAVRSCHAQLAAALADRTDVKVEVEAGFDRGRWTLGITLPFGGLRMFYIRGRYGGPWTPDPHQPLQIVANGKDLTEEAAGDLAAALALLLTKPDGGAPPSAGKIAGKAGTTRQRGVEVRNQVVIRT